MIQSNTKELLSHIVIGLICIGLADSRRVRREHRTLSLGLQDVYADSVYLRWHCLCVTETNKDFQCVAHYWSTMGDMMHQNFANTTVETQVLLVSNLQENTKYELYLRCQCCSTENGTPLIPVDSNMVTFLTGSHGAVTASSQQASDDNSKSSKITNHNCTISCEEDVNSGDQPTIYKEKSLFSNVLDTTLGVVFAVIGVVIAVVTLCYLWKGWQRRQQILQFFSPSEISSDQFDIIQQNMEESA